MPSSLFVFLLFPISIALLLRFWLNSPDILAPPIEFQKSLLSENDDKNSEIKIFNIKIEDDQMVNLKTKLEATRLPASTTDFWKNLTKVMIDYDLVQHQRFLNTFKQYKTEIEGVGVHFVRASIAPPKGSQVVSLVLLHGFPGSYWDFFKVIPILSNPRRFNYDFGVDKPLLFDVIVPSLPGFIFSGKSSKKDFSPQDSARILIRLMDKLGLENYFIHGNEELGVEIATIMAAIDPKVRGIHISNPFIQPFFSFKTAIKYLFPSEGSTLWDFYSQPQFRPTESSTFIATAVQDSPIGQCALIMQYWEIGSSSDQLNELFTLDELATICHLYWLTDSLHSGLSILNQGEKKEERFQVNVPVGILKTASAPWESADDILRHQYLNVTRITRLEKGGLFHALQMSEELAADIFRFVEVTLL